TGQRGEAGRVPDRRGAARRIYLPRQQLSEARIALRETASRAHTRVMDQHLYEAEHEAFRDLCRQFLLREAVPHAEAWEKAGIVDRDVWRKAGAAGLLGMDVDEAYGGGGQRDFRFNAVEVEEIIACGASGLGFGLHNDVVAPYLTELATEEQ